MTSPMPATADITAAATDTSENLKTTGATMSTIATESSTALLTAYSGGVRTLIPFRVHLVLDALAAVALLVVPFLLGFAGTPRAFYIVIGAAVLAVVACTRVEESSERRIPLRPASASAS